MMLEWYVIWLLPWAASIPAWLAIGGRGAAVTMAVLWLIVVRGVLYDLFKSSYKKWSRAPLGDRLWFEWTACREEYAKVKAAYDPTTYCKMDFKSFRKYFSVNQKRYNLRRSYVIFDNGNDYVEWRLIFPRRQLWKYFRFRRQWEQSRRCVDVLDFVQADIDAAREASRRELEKARFMLVDADIVLKMGDVVQRADGSAMENAGGKPGA